MKRRKELQPRPLDPELVARVRRIGIDVPVELEVGSFVIRREERARRAGDEPSIFRNCGRVLRVR